MVCCHVISQNTWISLALRSVEISEISIASTYQGVPESQDIDVLGLSMCVKEIKYHIVPGPECLSVYHQWKIHVLMQPLQCLLLFIHPI